MLLTCAVDTAVCDVEHCGVTMLRGSVLLHGWYSTQHMRTAAVQRRYDSRQCTSGSGVSERHDSAK